LVVLERELGFGMIDEQGSLRDGFRAQVLALNGEDKEV
jgi:hypothetical protein